jgi:aspartyl-tRNA(Asn)/glutamyl-tRNA(Gln) amidotransferase subunit B
VPDRELSDYFEEVARLSGEPQLAGNWIINTCRQFLNDGQLASVRELREKIPPARAADFIRARASGAIPSTAAAGVSAALLASDAAVAAIIAAQGLDTRAAVGDLEQWCREAITGNPKALADFKSGKDSAINGFKGPVMKAAKGKADPRQVDETLRRLLAQM